MGNISKLYEAIYNAAMSGLKYILIFFGTIVAAGIILGVVYYSIENGVDLLTD